MLKLTRLTDYGVLLMSHIARLPDGVLANARDVAEGTRLPLPTVNKLLKELTRKGLLASRRGVHGGYTLSRSAHAITVADLILALEGPIALTTCAGAPVEHEPCELECICTTRTNWHVLNERVRHALESVTLHDMAFPVAGGGGHALPNEVSAAKARRAAAGAAGARAKSSAALGVVTGGATVGLA